MIKGKNIELSYTKNNSSKEVTVLKGISFDLPKGRITTFMGKSGAGKTSLLKCIANLVATYKGTLTFHGKNIKKLTPRERASKVGFVFQQFHLFPHLTVLQNCMQPLKLVFGYSSKAAEKKTNAILNLLEMTSFADSFPAQLSGGQQQRAAIARALCLNPEFLLLDEPTSSLDPESTKVLEKILRKLKKRGITMVISSHDMGFIKGVLDKVYFLEEGTIVESFDALCEELTSKEKIGKFLGHAI